MISGVEVRYGSGSTAPCREAGGVWECGGGARVEVRIDGAVYVRVEGKGLDESWPVTVRLGLDFSRALALSADAAFERAYSVGFAYYNALGAGREPSAPRPPDRVDYPEGGAGEGPTPWAYPAWPRSPRDVPPFTELLLYEAGGAYEAWVAAASGDLAGYLGPGPAVSVYSGAGGESLSGVVAGLGRSGDPYEAVRLAARAAGLPSRESKPRPDFLEGLGWCSWNAMLTDVSERRVLEVVEGLAKKGLVPSWVLIDDGWQATERVEGVAAPALADLAEDSGKLPRGLMGLADALRRLGVRKVGLWVTVNGYWGGLSPRLASRYGGARLRSGQSFASPSEGARRFYEDLASWARSRGVDFLKVDNQVWLHGAFSGLAPSARAAREVLGALQGAAASAGLGVLSCMGVVPEAYSAQTRSNVMRACNDYIPFWRAGAKLHALFAAYASLLVSNVSYPDFDMFMSYDPHALAYLVMALLSGGPLYITDGDPSRTNVALLRRALLPDGRVAGVDEPGLPTRDVLFRNPYREPVALKLASTASGVPVVGAVNVSAEGARVEDRVDPRALPRPVAAERVAYLKSVSGEAGVARAPGLSLGELEAEVVALAPAEGAAVLGIAELLVPPAGVEVRRSRDGLVARARAGGTLVYYAGSSVREQRVRCCEEVVIG